MSLTLSNTQQNNSSNFNDPWLQNWGVIPIPVVYNYNSNLMTLTPQQTITFNIREIIGMLLYQNYEDFELLARQFYSPSSVPEWLSPDCYTDNGYPNSINTPSVYYNGLSFEFTPQFQNLPLLPSGTYTFNHEFIIRGLNTLGFWETIDSHIFQTVLNVTADSVVVFPEWINFFHTQGNTLPHYDISVNGDNWELRGYANFLLSSSTPGVIITSEIISGQTVYRATGSGVAIVRVTLGEFYDTESSYTFEETISGIDIYSNDVFLSAILISVDVATTPILSVTPNNLSFTAIKGIVEPEPQNLIILASEPPYTLTKSPWLETFETTAEINGVLRPVTSVRPLPTSSMDVGAYEGFVKVSDTVDGELVEITVRVNYELQGFVQSPYSQLRPAFTLDPLFFGFQTEFSNTYFQVDATIKTYDFFTALEKIKTISEKVPVFNGQGELNFGQTIHRLMNKFEEPNTSYIQYKPALLSLNVKEISIEDGSTIRETVIQDKPFLAGLSFGQIEDYGFLEFNKKADRVTLNSYYYLNIFVPQGTYELRVFKNQNQIETLPLTATSGFVVMKRIQFDDYQIGDVIEYTLNRAGDLETDVPKKTFYIIPEGSFSMHIAWESEFLLQSVFEFTGGAKIQSDFENRTQNRYKNFVEIMEIISNTKVNKLSISTGWIIKDSIDTIESLLRSKRAWLVLENKKIALRPITKTVISEDTERELVEFLIEFQINRSYNEETYFF